MHIPANLETCVQCGNYRQGQSQINMRRYPTPQMKRCLPAGSKMQVLLQASNGSRLPVQISLRPLAQDGFKGATLGMVVTDLSASRHSEEMLQALSRRLVEAQETERGRVALELHDNITQLLCAILVRCQTLADQLPAGAGAARLEALQLRDLIGQAAADVERITRDQRPGILENLGLLAVLRDTGQEFARRSGIPLQMAASKLPLRLPPEIELTLYRILQEALHNIEKHARARLVRVTLTRPRGFVQLTITDNGIGFDPAPLPHCQARPGGLGLLGMRERAAYVGGTLLVKSGRRLGTEIKIRIPLPVHPAATN